MSPCLLIGADIPIVEQGGVQGGISVQIVCERTDALMALGAHGRSLVQALSGRPASIKKARQAIAENDLSGKVWVSHFDGRRLPFADNVVNLIIADVDRGVPKSEIMRALAPRGVAMVGGEKSVKPTPAETDEWTRHLHDASGNAVAADSVVGSPKHLKRTARPLWSNHHHSATSLNVYGLGTHLPSEDESRQFQISSAALETESWFHCA